MTDPRSGKLLVTLYLRRQTGERPIVFKSDGERFPQPFTIKLNQDEVYDLRLVLQPSFKVESLLIHEEKVNLQKVKKATKHVADDEHSTTYTGEWKPQAFERTQRKARQQLKIAVILKSGGMLISTVQCKFYPVEEVSHSSWGESLTAIQFECHVNPSGGVLTINKQQFL